MKDATAAFIRTLFQFTDDDFNVYFCSLPNERDDPQQPGERRLLTREVEAVEKFVSRWDQKGRALYFCVSTMVDKRNKANAYEIAGAHGDIDFKDLDVGEEIVWAAIAKLRCQPTVVVRSGHGLHLYWLFHEPLKVQGNIERIEQALRQLCDMIGGDPQVCEVARLMRLPGTHNTKNGEWLPVTVERLDGPRYELDDLEEWLAESAPVLRRKAAAQNQPAAQRSDNPFLAAALAFGFKPPIDVEARLQAMTYGGAGDSSIHATQLSVSASLLNAGREVDEVVELLLQATRAAAGEYGTRWNWAREEKALRRMCETWLVKHPVEPTHPEPPPISRQPKRENAANVTADADNINSDATPDNVTDLGAARAKKKAKKRAKGDTPIHITVAEALLAVLEQRGERVLFTDKGSYRYRDGLWSLETDPALQGWLDTEIETCARGLSIDSASRLINETRKWIIRNPDLRREGVAWDAHGMVPTVSGLVHPRNGRLTPCQPEQYVTWRTCCRYEAEATCPLWLEMLGDVFADRPPDVKAHYVSLLQELAGAGLIDVKAKALSRALVLWGGQDSGKSGIIEVISALYGEERNTTPLAMLEQSHGTMGFLQRRPWVLYEAFDQNVWHLSASVKTIISGEAININVKNGPMLSRRYKAPILWATNHAPQFKEATKAIVERMVILQCRRVFDKNRPVGVAAKAHRLGFESPNALVIATEMEGVLAWAVEGLKRCLVRGYFDMPAETIEVAHQVRLDSNLAAEFMEDCVEYDPTCMISVPDFSIAHASWWGEHKDEARTPSSESLGKALRSLGDQCVAAGKELRDKHRRYYAGITLNEEGKRHWKNGVTSEAFKLKMRQASTTEPSGEPIRTIPRAWDDRPPVTAMREAQRNRHPSEPVTRGDTSHDETVTDPTSDEAVENADGIYFK